MITTHIAIISRLDDVDPNSIKQLINQVLHNFHIHHANITVILENDEVLRKMNQKYFHQNAYTDVISFRLDDKDKKQLEGEIYISIDRAKENSKNYGVSVNNELNRLIIHGTLHLLGFDDSTKEEKKEMMKLEDKFLN